MEQDPLTREWLGDGLAAMALYMFSRPKFDYFGWTIHFEQPLLNLFVAGSASESMR